MAKNKGKSVNKPKAPKPSNEEKEEQKRKSDQTAREMINVMHC
jgi:hypothetical protein